MLLAAFGLFVFPGWPGCQRRLAPPGSVAGVSETQGVVRLALHVLDGLDVRSTKPGFQTYVLHAETLQCHLHALLQGEYPECGTPGDSGSR